MTRTILVLALAALAGCGSTRHMQYDYGRATSAAFTAQADLSRASVQDITYELGGLEAAAIRLRAQEEVSDEETGESELTSGAMQ